MTEYELVVDKETENKLRWVTDVDGVPFKLYIPKAFVPQPPPERIAVRIENDVTRATAQRADIKAVVEYVCSHSETVRYSPKGTPDTWKIGEPYIPMTALTRPWPRQLQVAVSWKEQ